MAGASLNQIVPPVPSRSPVINPDGTMTQPWVLFFQKLAQRVGGSISPTIPQIDQEVSDLVTQFYVSEGDSTGETSRDFEGPIADIQNLFNDSPQIHTESDSYLLAESFNIAAQAQQAQESADTAQITANTAVTNAATAQTAANNANTNANTRVLKSGDTMTGNLNAIGHIVIADEFLSSQGAGTGLIFQGGNESVSSTGAGNVTIKVGGVNVITLSGTAATIPVGASISSLALTAASTATSATAGSATALPATPQLYFLIAVNGTVYKIPLYNT